ncbi:MAG: hypothetical protein DWQ08_07435 [Proteobacteria bacterium]|nr:MAG: hypothetical protein DWQ08_07435 [Pseudomonadota bacterium]
MKKLKPGHVFELAAWLSLAAVLFVQSFDFDREIEIYRYGAAAWPRAILLLIAVAAVGQLMFHLKSSNGSRDVFSAAADDGAAQAASQSHHNSPRWYLSTFAILLIPFVYLVVPGWIAAGFSLDKPGLETTKLVLAGVLVVAFLAGMRRNHVGAILALPIFFAALLQDFGFYALAPVFIVGVMFLMGERRPGRMLGVALATFAAMAILFVSVLYVGLPTGNISPFYDFGTGIVTLLQ